jgi:hypothetical protein
VPLETDTAPHPSFWKKEATIRGEKKNTNNNKKKTKGDCDTLLTTSVKESEAGSIST